MIKKKIKMKNIKIIILLITITLSSFDYVLSQNDTSNILYEVSTDKNKIEEFYRGCERLKKINQTDENRPSSKNCAIATLEWDYKCCFVQIGEKNLSCMYLRDNNKWIKDYKKTLGDVTGETIKIECGFSYLKFSLFLILIFFIF